MTTATPRQIAYLDSLVDYVLKSGGLRGRSVEQAIREAHAEVGVFVQEVRENETDRAHTVREVMTDELFVRCQKM